MTYEQSIELVLLMDLQYVNQPTITPAPYVTRVPPGGLAKDHEIDMSRFKVRYRFIENQALPKVISNDPFTGFVNGNCKVQQK